MYSDGTNGIPPAYIGNQMLYLIDQSSITATFQIPTNQVSNQYGFCFKAAQRKMPGATASDQQMLQVWLDYGTPNQKNLFARSYSQGGMGKQAYNCPDSSTFSKPWDSRIVSWVESTYYSTQTFSANPGETHTLTFVGIGNPSNASATNLCVFIGDVKIASLDAFFATGIPSDGEATGQPAGQNIIATLQSEVNWSKAFDLEMLCYESGWSLGGDNGGSPLQNTAKFSDNRTSLAQQTFINYFQQAGGTVCIFGAYEQWPSWTDAFAQQGILNASSYPLVAGTNVAQNQLPIEPTNGSLLPNNLYYTNQTANSNGISNNSLNVNIPTYGWITWNVIATSTNDFQVNISTTGTGSFNVLIDENIVGGGVAGSTLTIPINLLKGLHCLKIKSIAGKFVIVGPILVSTVNSMTAPNVPTISLSGTTVTVNWDVVNGATSYIVRYGQTVGQLSNSISSTTNSVVVNNLISTLPTYFEVLACNANSVSMPSLEVSVIPVLDNTPNSYLGYYSVQKPAFYNGSLSNLPGTSGPNVALSDITLGTGLKSANGYYYMFASSWNKKVDTSTLLLAASNGIYYQFNVTPNNVVNSKSCIFLSEITAYIGNASGTVSVVPYLQYSLDNINFITLPYSSFVAANYGWGANLYTFNTSNETLLQGFKSKVYFRIVGTNLTGYLTLGVSNATPALALYGSDSVYTDVLNGLTHQWTLNGITNDTFGLNGIVTPTVNSPTYVSGLANQQSLSLNHQYLLVPKSSDFSFAANQSFTFSTWVNFSSFTGSWQGVMTIRNNGNVGIWLS